jgi:hypothetical protein
MLALAAESVNFLHLEIQSNELNALTSSDESSDQTGASVSQEQNMQINPVHNAPNMLSISDGRQGEELFRDSQNNEIVRLDTTERSMNEQSL